MKIFPINEIIPNLIKARLAKNKSNIVDDKVKLQIINLLKRKGFTGVILKNLVGSIKLFHKCIFIGSYTHN